MTQSHHPVGTSFDCFGTLIDVDTPDEPAAVVARELEARDVPVPVDWKEAYRTPHADAAKAEEVPLPTHVRAALESRDVDVPPPESNLVRAAVLAAFETEVRTRDGATEAVEVMADRGPVGILSNCSVPGLVERSLTQSTLEREQFDAIVTSVDCGWRKPDRRAFEEVADLLGVALSRLVHVGDDPETDGKASDAGATVVLVEDVPLAELPEFITEHGGNC
jgi:FMN phosphatase YigB (HAD superfamily)